MLKKNIEFTQDQIAWLLIIIILIVAGVIRYSLIGVPFERDEGEYAYAGQLILKGIPPYKEVFNMKLPGIYYAYSLLLYIFGETHQGVHFGLIIINGITTIFVFLLARLFFSNTSSVFSAACFAYLSLLGSVQGLFANAEHFVLLFSVPGAFFLVRGVSERTIWRLFLSGLLFGIGFLIKQHGAAFCVFGAVYLVCFNISASDYRYNRFFRDFLLYGIGVILTYVLICVAMATQGVFDEFWFWTVEYAMTYITQVSLIDALLVFNSNSRDIILSAPFIWLVIGLGFFLLLSKKTSQGQKKFLFLFLLFSFLSICPGFFFRPHYFILLLPSVCLVASLSMDVLPSFFNDSQKNYKWSIVITALIVFAFGYSIYTQRKYLFFMNSSQISRSIYGLNPFIESIAIAEYIRNNSRDEDKIAILGSEPQIMFYAKRQSASGHIYMYPLMEKHEYSLKMQKKFIEDIEANKPKFIVFVNIPTSWLASKESNMEILDWFKHYSKNKTKIVGLIDIFSNYTHWNWGENAHLSPASKYYVVVYERQ